MYKALSTGSVTTNIRIATACDPALLRHRYYNPNIGRFTSFDSFEADADEPQHLHKYNYAGADPVNSVDPSGNDFFGVLGQLIVAGVHLSLRSMSAVGAFIARQAAYALIRTQVAFYTASARLAVALAGAGGAGAFRVHDRVMAQLRDPRLGNLANRLTPTILQRMVSNPAAQRFVDTRAQNLNNIQIVQRVPGFSENTLVRITLAANDPNLIISVGPVGARFIQNLTNRGAWRPIP